MTTVEDAKPALTSDYAQVYGAALTEEMERPISERTRFSHAVAADAVAVHAVLDAALALEKSDLDAADAVTFVRAHAETLEGGRSSTLRRHKGVSDAVALMAPAYAAWVTRNTPNVARRLEDFVDADTAKVLLAHFHISEKDG